MCAVCGAPPAALGAPSGAVAAAPVAAGACLLRVCEAAPHEGLSFIATIMELLALGRSTGGSTAPMALECLATMAEAGELAPLPLLALLRTTFGVDPANSLSPQQAGGSSTAWATAIYGSGDGQSDAGGAALVRCLACVAEFPVACQFIGWLMEAADGVIEIPTFGAKNSLNVASAAAVVIFEVLRQWGHLDDAPARARSE